jgi:predicted NAD/FAD-dependent oxidoreductase
LQQTGFSEEMIDDFFKPFFSGVFLEKDLLTSSRMLDFTFAMFSRGEATLPADGMEAIPRQLAKQLSPGTIRTQTTVSQLGDGKVHLDDGSSIDCDAIVVATEMPAAARLLHNGVSLSFRSTSCVYFDAGNAPIESPVIVLNCDTDSIVNSLCCPNRIQPSYAPKERTLISVTSIGPMDLSPSEQVEAVRDELRGWFGGEVDRWRALTTYNIPYALPDQSVQSMELLRQSPRVRDNIYRCGDYCDTRSIDGAIRSGEYTAQTILADLKSN